MTQILEISFPKSGTHLLWQILQALMPPAEIPMPPPFFSVFESDGTTRTEQDALAWLDRLLLNDVAASHLYAWRKVMKRVRNPPFVTYFLYRDPRDICVSYVHHVMNIDVDHYHHAGFAALPDFSARLMASILDVPGGDSDIGQRFRPYLDWLDCPHVLNIRFTDLVGNQLKTLKRIIVHFDKHAGYPPFVNTPEALANCIHPEFSGTFTTGTTGKWKKHFTEAHKRIFKDVAGDLLIKLGYEKDYDW